ncbi:MAG TPA: DUF1684 domain-containing protein [Stellaceae bacterium]|nr:DUF1684 domain-containing protein [Stellaceae bacterium]
MSAEADGGRLALWDWRRRVSALYAEIRGESDPVAAWWRWREARDRLFRDHPQSPLEPAQRARFRGLAYGDYDPSLRFAAVLHPVADGIVARFDAGADGSLTLAGFARTEGLARPLGRELTLFWIEGYAGSVFLPFTDGSTGRTSYGAGRYLLDTLKGADLGSDAQGHAILDFNFAYNPSCAYSPRWACPLAPSENALPATIHAGERKYDGPVVND